MLETKPDKMTLSDWQAVNGNIFKYLNVPDSDEDMMEFLLASMYGERKVRLFFENKSAQEVGGLVDSVYGDKWQKDFDLFKEFTALEGDAVSTAQVDSTVDIKRSTDTNQINKTSGFDGVELVDDNGADITGKDDTTNTASNSSKNISVTQDGLLAKAKAVKERKFHEQICNDIARFITLSIY